MWSSHFATRKKCEIEITIVSDGKLMKAINDEGYKYLGILESDKIKENEMKLEFVKEYKRRVRLTLKSKLNGKN